ncbi:unnamed protein product [Miscanthus lutarioriparius]|uniref:Helitron helicase-like domain-containing protein n=1 Tax=Miscanthus lutarioriparius TaxID=422564 RepID=A0A811M9J8_9POAL|nr:unnamed protein product [Miscanthus lutarioriparius]
MSHYESRSNKNVGERRKLLNQHRRVWRVSYPGRSYHGPPAQQCSNCHAIFWNAESVGKEARTSSGSLIYNKCCKGGRVVIPPFLPRPEPLASLARFDGESVSTKFMKNIRRYNCLLAFTSMGANIDRTMNDARGPPVFKICGLIHHRIGSLIPPHGRPPKFIQLYVYDTSAKVENRIASLDHEDTTASDLDPTLVQSLVTICREYGPPDFFVTFTCNPKWLEIFEAIFEPGQRPSDRNDIVVRVFNIKLEELLHDIRCGTPFGPCSRDENNIFVCKGGLQMDNRWVVPYNMFLLKKYQAHINVEWCNKTTFIKYLFKYVTKGADCSKAYLQRVKRGQQAPYDDGTKTINEVKEYIDCRYIYEQDACWRMFGYDIHRHYPAVERMHVHLPNENFITFSARAKMDSLFVTMILFCEVGDENTFFEKIWRHLADNIIYQYRDMIGDPNYVLPDSVARDYLLDELSTLFSQSGRNIADFSLPPKTHL